MDILNLPHCKCGSGLFVIDIDEIFIQCLNCTCKFLITDFIKKNKQKINYNYIDSEKNMLSKYKKLYYRSSKKKLDICTFEEFKNWYSNTLDDCVYCQGKMKDIHSKGSIMSIDRMDNTKGYVINNIAKSCYVCNSIKNEFLTFDQAKNMIGNFIINQTNTINKIE